MKASTTLTVFCPAVYESAFKMYFSYRLCWSTQQGNKIHFCFFLFWSWTTLAFLTTPLTFLIISLNEKLRTAWLNGFSEPSPWKEMLLSVRGKGPYTPLFRLHEGELCPEDRLAVPDFILATTSASQVTLSLYAATLAWVSRLSAGMQCSQKHLGRN